MLAGEAGAGKTLISALLASNLAGRDQPLLYLDYDGGAAALVEAQLPALKLLALNDNGGLGLGLLAATEAVHSGSVVAVIIDSLDAFGAGEVGYQKLIGLVEVAESAGIPLLATCGRTRSFTFSPAVPEALRALARLVLYVKPTTRCRSTGNPRFAIIDGRNRRAAQLRFDPATKLTFIV